MTSYTLSAITALLGGRYTGTDIEINGVRPLDSATASHISFLSNPKYRSEVSQSQAGVVIVNEKMETKIPGIYGAGDVVVKPLRQIVTAVNDGAIAAQTAFHYIKELE